MKAIAIIMGLMFVAGSAWTQDTIQEEDENKNEVKTLLGKYNEIKGFGALDIKVTDVLSDQAMVIGAYGGVIVNKQVMLGLGGYGFATDIDFNRAG